MDSGLITKIAKLSNLKLTDAEKLEFQGQITSILAHVRSLETVDTRGVVDRPCDISGSVAGTPLRDDDRPEESAVIPALNLVEASEGHIQGLFEVPQVVGSG